ncbi:hypothetical protein A0H81_08084 [Grifola frondosa]|uniref:SH3 domain-containing protein n=1 Tax=Grifola frondosa TaxID=5627 RepID=A0A1C7M4N7_GRIFR|nr:hypothetical protein A0H81_08084 [Grifola frondosa]
MDGRGQVPTLHPLLSTPDASSTGFPRPPPRRNPSSSNEESSYVQPEHNRLVPVKKFGDVDLSSGKNMYNSLRHSTANKTATPPPVAPPVPSAFPARKSFAPPPMRRVPSTVSVSDAVAPSPPPPIPSRARQEEEVNGEWAEAVYDYSSEDPGDLELQAEQRVLVVEKTSDDWWTGEIGGRRGLIPAAYVKIL